MMENLAGVNQGKTKLSSLNSSEKKDALRGKLEAYHAE